MTTHRPIEDALLDPHAYPWAPESVTRMVTHLSVVFLAGNYVVKIKRPVDLGFVDFRLLETRRLSCEDEVRLNRDLTSDVYRSVAPITNTDGRVTVGGHGPAIEWATVMRRLPSEGMLDTLINRGAVPVDLANVLAKSLIPFHRARTGTCDGPTAELERAATRVVTENLDHLLPFSGIALDPDQFDLISQAINSFIASSRELLAERAEGGWIIEGHGDLRAEHICLEQDGRLQIFDCVEFSKAIRCADVASDLAFLLMDLERLGQIETAAAVLDLYRDAGFALPDPILRFYKAHRALVRAKVSCLTIETAGHDDRANYLLDAADYLAAATSATTITRPSIVAVTGLSGTGKSTVAQKLSRALRLELLSSDQIRKEIAGVVGSGRADWGKGIYSAEWTNRTYTQLMRRSGEIVKSGVGVILDASFLEPLRRLELAHLAKGLDVPLTFVDVTCEPEVVERRISDRARIGLDSSDATVAIYRAQLAKWGRDISPPIAEVHHIGVDTSREEPARIGAVIKSLAESGSVTIEI